MTGSETGSGSPAGQTLAQYQVREKLADGELGTVYLARDAAAGRDVALEVLPAKGPIDPDRLRQEVKSASALEHWNIAKVYEFGTSGDQCFIAREYAGGRMLREVLRSGPMDTVTAGECARQIASALAAGHAIGVTHRHLNPGNIMIGEQNRVKLVNFGLSVPPALLDRAFAAPEQLDGRGADARADIYSFGMVLRGMLGSSLPRPLDPIVGRSTRKDVGRRYQLMDDVISALERAAADPTAAAKDHGHRLLIAAGVLVALVLAAGWWLLGGRNAMNQGPSRITSDSGLATDGAISPDGRMIVYASDRASAGTLNLWMQPLSGGTPVRLTQGPDDDHQPSFSTDASHIAFRSERDGGGIYLVGASGGTPELLVKGGRNPRFSPDGHWIAYWSGSNFEPRGGGVWVIASSGGPPVRVHGEFEDARYPVWSPDGKRILFVGHAEQLRHNITADWFVVSFENGRSEGQATRTGAETLLHMQAFRENSEGYYSGSFAIPEAWASGQVLFSGRMTPMGKQGSGLPRLQRMPLSPDIMQATGAAHEITSGADWDAHPSLSASGHVVYTRREQKAEIWSVAPDGSGDPHRVTQDTGDVRPAVSRDGKRVAYRAQLPDGKAEVRVVDVAGGKQIAHIPYDSPRDWPVLLSPSGDEIVYSSDGITRMRLPDGKPQRISRRGWDQATSWSSDGRYVLVQRGWRGLGVVEITTGRDRELTRDDRFPVVEARFSPDDKWIVYTVASRPHPQVFVTSTAAESAPRTAITEEDVSAASPAWSIKGDQIYFLTPCQGFRCIWARRVDPRTKAPQGESFAIRHFHSARYSLIGGIDPQNVGLVAAGDKLVFGMFETTGNIWTLPSLPRP